MEALSPSNQECHGLLEAFRRDVWGNPSIFVQKSESPHRPGRTVEYLDLESHLAAVQLFCGALMRKELLVTQEYRNAMDKFKSNDLLYENGASIIGQPGIGKSVFIAYAVIERLREKQLVAVEIAWGDPPGAYVVFSEHGVGLHPRSTLLRAYVPDIWAFSDSTALAPIPSPAFLATPHLRIFQTASPDPKRWKRWTVERQVELYIMDLWSVEEIEDLIFISKYNDRDAERIRTLLDMLGPVPRTLITSVANDQVVKVYESHVTEAMGDPDAVTKALLKLDNTINPGSSGIFFVSPLKEEDIIYRGVHTVSIPTRWLVNKLVVELGRHHAAEQMKFFRALSSHPRTRSSAGWVFEEIVHEFLVRAGSVSVHWYDKNNTSVVKLPPGVLNTYADLNAPPPFYWRPDDPSNRGVDSAIVTNDHIYVIQTTISRKHTTPQDGLNNLWRSMPQDKKALKWAMLFAGETESQTKEVSAPYARSLTVGDARTRKKDKVLAQVGWFSIFSHAPYTVQSSRGVLPALSDTTLGMSRG
ncbi:hypothetical protein HD554DRAFT_1450554 [Boletus coccyginus]|nr:hypothetical protein HD554DRAFT_1450554 [Boletus coccyginus]